MDKQLAKQKFKSSRAKTRKFRDYKNVIKKPASAKVPADASKSVQSGEKKEQSSSEEEEEEFPNRELQCNWSKYEDHSSEDGSESDDEETEKEQIVLAKESQATDSLFAEENLYSKSEVYTIPKEEAIVTEAVDELDQILTGNVEPVSKPSSSVTFNTTEVQSMDKEEIAKFLDDIL